MKIEPTAIRDVYIIAGEPRGDDRGFFMETYRSHEFEKAGIHEVFVQHNHSRSNTKNTVRGLHFQWGPPMGKLMRVTRGAAFIVAVDLREGSPTRGKWIGIEASEDNKLQLYAPGNFARGLQTLTDVCEVQYLCSAYYDQKKEGNIRWDDPAIGIDWPLKETPLLSPKDAGAPSLSEWFARPEAATFVY